MRADRIILGGAPEGYDARLVLAELAKGRPGAACGARWTSGPRRCGRAGGVRPDVPVLEFPAWDCLPYDRVSPQPRISSRRMAALATLADGLPGTFILLSTLNAVTQRIPARDVVRGVVLSRRGGRPGG